MGELENRLAVERAFEAWEGGRVGDMVIAYFDASATVRDGGRYDNTYTWFLRMRDGVVVEAVAFFDSIAFDDLWRRVQPSYSAS